MSSNILMRKELNFFAILIVHTMSSLCSIYFYVYMTGLNMFLYFIYLFIFLLLLLYSKQFCHMLTSIIYKNMRFPMPSQAGKKVVHEIGIKIKFMITFGLLSVMSVFYYLSSLLLYLKFLSFAYHYSNNYLYLTTQHNTQLLRRYTQIVRYVYKHLFIYSYI